MIKRLADGETDDDGHVRERELADEAAMQDTIRMRAYELYESRGRRAGGELADWLRAERECRHHRGE